ncbi:MAG: hypothetical protein ACRD5Z_13615 [Bryobacteraceae bacterium]
MANIAARAAYLATGFCAALFWLGAELALLATLPRWLGVEASVSTLQSHMIMNGRQQQNTATAIRIQNVF